MGNKIIYTSYFAKIRNLPDNVVPVSISSKAPNGYTGLQYKRLAPTYNIFMNWKRTGNNSEYTEQYNKIVLGGLNQQEVINDIYQSLSIPDDKYIALVCYEKSTDFCHRHLVTKWLNQDGYEVKEYGQ